MNTNIHKIPLVKLFFSLLCVLVSFWMIKTIISLSSYSVLVADDFMHANGLGYDSVTLLGHIKRSINYSIRFYNTWQGTYFSMFLQALLSPLNGHGLAQLKIVMVLNSVLFFTSYILFFWISMLHFDTKENYHIKLFIITVAIFLLLNRETFPEVFTWYSGATSYSFPLSLLLIALSLTLLTESTDSILLCILASIIGFIAMGGSLTVAGTGCYLMLLFFVRHRFSHGKFNKKLLCIFLVWFTGALINTVAPGNFTRHDAIYANSIRPLKAVSNSFLFIEDHYQQLFRETDYIAFFLVLIIVGFLIGAKTTLKLHSFYSKLLVLLLPIVSIYPLLLGYEGGEVPDRCIFIVDFSIVVSTIYFAISLGIWAYTETMSSKLIFSSKQLLFITILVFAIDGFGIKNINILYVAERLSFDTYKEYHQQCEYFYDYLSGLPKGTDQYISIQDCPQPLDNIYNFYLEEDSSHFTNTSVAEYYNLNSINIYSE